MFTKKKNVTRIILYIKMPKLDFCIVIPVYNEEKIILNIINKALSTSKYEHQLKKEWDSIYPESIDYGILEKANDVYTIQADFKWNDLGSSGDVYLKWTNDDDESVGFKTINGHIYIIHDIKRIYNRYIKVSKITDVQFNTQKLQQYQKIFIISKSK